MKYFINELEFKLGNVPVYILSDSKSKIIFQMETDGRPERYEQRVTKLPDGRDSIGRSGEELNS